MKYLIILCAALLLSLQACNNNLPSETAYNINWEKRAFPFNAADSSFIKGSSYLSVYRAIYNQAEKMNHQLTVTASIRNTSSTDSVFILKADYFNSEGKLIRTYLDKPIYLKPLESIEIGINDTDRNKGTGSSLVFDWASKNPSLEPYFEAVMLMTAGQQGISFTTKGIKR